MDPAHKNTIAFVDQIHCYCIIEIIKTAFISFANELPVVFVAAGMAVIPMGKLGAWVVSGYW